MTSFFPRLLEMVRGLEEGGSPVAVVEVGSGMLDPRVKVRCVDISTGKNNSSSGEEFVTFRILCIILPPLK